jgi:hypothetical protein
VKEKVAENDRQWAERNANPGLRAAETSQFSQIRKAIDEKKRPDPLMQTKEERHRSTVDMIQRDLAEKEQVQ